MIQRFIRQVNLIASGVFIHFKLLPGAERFIVKKIWSLHWCSACCFFSSRYLDGAVWRLKFTARLNTSRFTFTIWGLCLRARHWLSLLVIAALLGGEPLSSGCSTAGSCVPMQEQGPYNRAACACEDVIGWKGNKRAHNLSCSSMCWNQRLNPKKGLFK